MASIYHHAIHAMPQPTDYAGLARCVQAGAVVVHKFKHADVVSVVESAIEYGIDAKEAMSWGGHTLPLVIPSMDVFRQYVGDVLHLEGGRARYAVATYNRFVRRAGESDAYEYGHSRKVLGDDAIAHYVKQRDKAREFMNRCEVRNVVTGEGRCVSWEAMEERNRAYINARMDGVGVDGWINAMVTVTLHPVWHRMTTAGGNKRVNDKWNLLDAGEAAKELQVRWKRARAAWAKSGLRAGVNFRGVRVVEPHGDGTPHAHILIAADAVGTMDLIVRGICNAWHGVDKVKFKRVRVRDKHGERETYRISGSGDAALDRNLVKVDVMQDAAGAARYVAKYVAKNLESDMVKAWLSTYGIRQFAFFGGRLSRRMWDILGAAKLQVMVPARVDIDVLVPSWSATERKAIECGYTLLPMVSSSRYKSCLIDAGMNVLYAAPRYMLIEHKVCDMDVGDGVIDTVGCGEYGGYFDADKFERMERVEATLQKRHKFEKICGMDVDAVGLALRGLDSGVVDFWRDYK